CQRDGTQLRACDPRGRRLVVADPRGEAFAERPQQVGPRLEAVLVEVVARAAAAAKHEVTLEIGVLPERATEIVVSHASAAAASTRGKILRACARGSEHSSRSSSPIAARTSRR